jgi:hypothetical protein
VRFQALTAASMKFRVFWDIAPCSHVEVDRRLRDAYCLHHQGDYAVRTSETSVNFNVTTQRYIPKDSELRNCSLRKMQVRFKLLCHNKMAVLSYSVTKNGGS